MAQKRKAKRLLSLKFKKKSPYVFSLFLSTVLLTMVGVFMIYNASAVEAYRDFQDKFFYLKYQSLYALLGLVAMLVFSKVKIIWLKKIAFGAFLLNLFFLVLVLIPGIGSRLQGSSRWISLGGFVFQPSETMKLINIIYLSTWLEKKPSLKNFLIVSSLPALLVLIEPDLGTAAILFISSCFVYFLSGAAIKNLIMVLSGAFLAGISFIISSAYRRSRLLTFLDPGRDPLGASYHIKQILLALASGGLTGVGLGQSRQKYSYLPEAATDSIFAVYAEEAGLLGALLLIFVFIYFIFLIFRIAQRSPNRFAKILIASIGSWLAIQIFFNLSAMVALIPLTGIPLPFISYGGSSLIVNLIAVGIIMSAAKEK